MFKSVKATTAIEYGLIAILLSAPVGVAFGLLGDQLYTDVSNDGVVFTQDATSGEWSIDDTGAIADLMVAVKNAFEG